MLGLGTLALIRDGQHNILFDTGNGVIRPQIKGMLAEHGLDFEAIDMIILSHLHWDHTFNYDFFPRAKYVVSKREWDSANDLVNRDIFVGEAIIPFLRTAKLRLIETDGEEILPGMKAIFTPGHTLGCMSVLLEQDGERWMLTGDAVKTRGELRTGCGGMSVNAQTTRETIEKIKAMADRILPGHDSWLAIRDGDVFPEENELVLRFSEGVMANGGQDQITIRLD